jgi:O-antigen/teichoic acid export membrane protein
MSFLIIKIIGFKFPNFSKIKDYLSFGLSTISGNISNWAVQSSDRYFIGYFLSPVFVAYYSPAYTLGTIINMFLTPLNIVLPAVLAKSFDENKLDEVKIYLKYSLKYFMLLAIPSAFGLSILSKSILRILSTAEISNNGFFITPFVLLSMLFLGAKAILGQPIMLAKKVKINSAIWTLAAVINIGLNFIFVPKWGILGAALTTLIAYFTTLIGTILVSIKYIKFDIDYLSIAKSLLAASVMSMLIYYLLNKLNPYKPLELILLITIGTVIYGSMLILLKSFEKKELKFFKTLLVKST